MDKNYLVSKPFKIVLVAIIAFIMISTSVIVLIVNSNDIIRTPRQVLAEHLEGLRDKDIHKVARTIAPVDSAHYNNFVALGDDYFKNPNYSQLGNVTSFNIFNKINQRSTITANITFIPQHNNGIYSERHMTVSFNKYYGQWYLSSDLLSNSHFTHSGDSNGDPVNNVYHRLTDQQKADYSTNDDRYKSHTVPDGEQIDSQTFFGCTYLNEITITMDITYFAPGWFFECKNLVAINILNSSTYTAEDGVVYSKDKSALVYFPIGKGEAAGSPEGEFHIPNGVTQISKFAFSRYNGQINKFVFPPTVRIIDEDAFHQNYSSANSYQVALNEGLLTIGDNAFESNRIASISLPSTVTTIGAEAFKDTEYLHTFDIPQNSALTTIGEGAFAGATALSQIYLPTSTKHLANWTFDGCINLREINLHSGFKSIGIFAFRGCTGLFELYIPQSVDHIGKGAFQTTRNLTLSIEVYNKPNGWHSDWNLGADNTIKWGVLPPKNNTKK